MVPHQAILGVNVVDPRRLRLLAGTVVSEGYDSIAANLNCVSVQQKPLPSGEAGNSFQVAFSSSLKAEHDIAEFGPGETIALAGCLSNADLNCVLRNVFAGVRGCECMNPTVVGNRRRTECICQARSILDMHGNYSMDLLHGHDKDLWDDVLTGLVWEELSWVMEEEEPDAAVDIALAFDKANEAAMKTGFLEIFTAMTNLMNPDPTTGYVKYELVLDQLIETYGPCLNDLDFVWVFRFAFHQRSIWLERLRNFTTICVSRWKERKMQIAVYAHVAFYPVKVPGIKNACIKWSWRKRNRRG